VSPDDLAGRTEVLDRWFAAFNRHDVDGLCDLADPNIEVLPLPVAESTPPGTSYHGHDGLRALLDAGFKRFPQMRIRHTTPEPNGSQISVELEFVLDDGNTPARHRTTGCNFRIARGRVQRIRAFEEQLPPRSGSGSRAETLSRREREVLSMLAGGNTVRDIANQLVLSPFTVRTHIRNAKDKLHARTTAHAVAIGLSQKVLDV
jgi:DNA-binding CsgD family transcriptional regulator